ncbi:MAG: hypothetical protein M1834_002865 [Cirrosporium novae-zelandiae]|nr:MAG: hypothetical protein M1834_002865 [Cirrosporium novae-zelandiae]
MPRKLSAAGRVSGGNNNTHGHGVSRTSRRKNSRKDRSLNALAIAEKQIPEQIKIQRHRLGEVEGDERPRRKRQAEDDEDEDGEEDGDERDMKRRKKARVERDEGEDEDGEQGSDSEGNEWQLGGHVDSEDDSDIDSDEAFGESDEERFEGFTFRGSSKFGKKKNKVKPSQNDLQESGDEDGDSDGSLGEDAVDLATILDQPDSDEDIPPRKNIKERLQPDSDEEMASDGDEEEVEEDDSESEEESNLFSSESDDDQDESKFDALQDLVSSIQNTSAKSSKKKSHTSDPHESAVPSSFGINTQQKLSLSDLLSTVNDPSIKKSLKLLASDDKGSRRSKRTGIPGKIDVPLAKRQQDRLDRAAAYDKAKETLGRWVDTVKHNRRVEHLQFPLVDPNKSSAEGTNRLISTANAKPMNELENTIQSILLESGLITSSGKSAEDKVLAFEELKTNKLPLEEVQRRRAELRKARDLLFQEEVRAKRIKKIKSKAYRRVHRKEREKASLAEREALISAGVNVSEDEQERNDRRRAEERMGARHKESKWAKSVKASGRAAWDEDTRAGVTEMARRGEELKRRIEGKPVDESDNSDVSEDGDSDASSDLADSEERARKKYQKQLDRVAENPFSMNGDRLGSRLSGLKFMQKADAARKAQNEEDIERLRRELAGEDSDIGSDNEEEPAGRRIFGPSKSRGTNPKIAEQKTNEFEEAFDSDDETARKQAAGNDNEEVEIITDVGSSARSKSNPRFGGRPLSKISASQTHHNESDNEDATENPWLAPPSKKKSKTHDATSSSVPILNDLPPMAVSLQATSSRKQVQKESAASKPSPNPPKLAAPSSRNLSFPQASHGDSEEETPVLSSNRNEDAVRKAFAGDDVEAEFEKEKEEIIKEDDDKIIDNTLPGWGSWMGEGISKKAMKRQKGKFLTKEEGIKAEKRKDAKMKKVIISEKKIKKNSKYLATQLPYPFETRAQYERSLRLPMGPEWTTKETFQEATKPRILIKQGVINPMEKPRI